MTRPQPKKAKDNPKAARMLGAVLKQRGQQSLDPSMTDMGQQLEEIAQQSQKLPQGPLAPAMRKLRKAMTPPSSN